MHVRFPDCSVEAIGAGLDRADSLRLATLHRLPAQSLLDLLWQHCVLLSTATSCVAVVATWRCSSGGRLRAGSMDFASGCGHVAVLQWWKGFRVDSTVLGRRDLARVPKREAGIAAVVGRTVDWN
ncbi:hypothetical protein DFJ73DRAFT_796944 [Zopfochytrium polystomum]|nr:hypothetical protein DFJ73DRAFT_796944 [Zopfochytrium polystomum]